MNPRPSPARIEPLEARIAPAIALQHPLPDLVAGPGKTGAVIDLSEMFDPSATSPNRTIVEFVTNFDTDTNTPGIQAGVIRIELFDDLVPLTVQNFLTYLNSKNAKGDYDNTFFHRAGALDGVSAVVEVLQGGGYELAKSQAFHIDGSLPLHNEYREDTPNERGTISMAKTGVSPNTATSEFFINVADNSTGLGSGNNGGFTVFGRLTDSSLAIVDAIGALAKQQLIGTFGAPVQNYIDPDGNPATVNPVPTADQIIRITDARVVPPNVGNATGITYTVEHIYAAGTTTPSNLVSGKISGTALNLKYRAGAAGEVDVVVKAVGPGGALDTVSDTFRVTVQPNLIASVLSDALPGFLTAGDAATVKLKLSNSGGGAAKGTVDVHFILAEVNTTTGALESAGARIPVGDVLNRSISVAGGGSVVIAARVQIPSELLSDTTKTYRLIAEVEPSAELASRELFSDDNTALDGNAHQVLNQFGGFNTRTNVPLSYVESDGDRVTFSLTGGGVGKLAFDGDGKIDLNVSGTTVLSKLSARITKAPGGDGRIDLNDLNFTDGLNSVALGLADVDGTIAAGGGLRSLLLGNLTGPGSLSIGALLPANATGATIKLGRVSDYSFESVMPIASLTAVEWLDTGGFDETLSFYSLGKLNITGARNVARGDLQASVDVAATGAVASISVAGLLDDAVVTAVGNIGSIVLGGMNQSSIFAGTTARPGALGDFFADSTISKFTIKGIAGFAGDLFVDSQVAAQNFGSISVQKVAPANSGTAFGFVADVIKSYNRVGGARLARLDAPASLDLATDYRVTIL